MRTRSGLCIERPPSKPQTVVRCKRSPTRIQKRDHHRRRTIGGRPYKAELNAKKAAGLVIKNCPQVDGVLSPVVAEECRRPPSTQLADAGVAPVGLSVVNPGTDVIPAQPITPVPAVVTTCSECRNEYAYAGCPAELYLQQQKHVQQELTKALAFVQRFTAAELACKVDEAPFTRYQLMSREQRRMQLFPEMQQLVWNIILKMRFQ